MRRRAKWARVRWAWGVVPLALAAWTALHPVASDERAVVLRFGRVARVVGPGLRPSLPWPIERVRRVSTGEVRTIDVGFRRADRARGLPPEPREVQWLTADTNIVEVQATVNWSVVDPVAWLFAAGGGEAAPEHALRLAVESAFSAAIASTPIDEVLSGGQAAAARRVRDAAQDQVDRLGLGLRIGSVNLVSASAPQAVIGAFNDVSSARSDRERRVTQALGFRAERLPEARARASRVLDEARRHESEVLARARSEADRFLRLQAEIEKAPELARARIWYESARELLGRGTLRVVQPPEEGSRRRVWLGR